MEVEACSSESLLYGTDEVFYVAVASFSCGAELFLYHVVHVRLKILEREVFEFALYQIESELMCQGCIEMSSLGSHSDALFIGAAVFDLTHEVDAVGYDDEDDTHVFGKGEEQVTEVFGLYGRIFGIEFVDPEQSSDDVRHFLSEVTLYVDYAYGFDTHASLEHDAEYRGAVESYFLNGDEGRLQVEEYGVESKLVTAKRTCLYSSEQDFFHLVEIIGIEHIA